MKMREEVPRELRSSFAKQEDRFSSDTADTAPTQVRIWISLVLILTAQLNESICFSRKLENKGRDQGLILKFNVGLSSQEIDFLITNLTQEKARAQIFVWHITLRVL